MANRVGDAGRQVRSGTWKLESITSDGDEVRAVVNFRFCDHRELSVHL